MRSLARCLLLGLPLQGALLGCSMPAARYDPAAFRAQIAARAPELRGQEVVLFEVPPEAVELARRVTAPARSDLGRVELLARALFDPAAFGLRYDPGVTGTAREALAQKQGNCVGLTSAFIGLARAIGLDVHYIDASRRVSETKTTGRGPTVTAGHLTAVAVADGRRVGLDVTRDGTFVGYMELDDLTALAHYYNNLGFERIAPTLESGEASDWAAARDLFRRAIRVDPRFARAWSNYGLSLARLGDQAEATVAYERAIALDPQLAAPRVNLGALRLDAGDGGGAVTSLEAAAALEPEAAHIQFLLARALLRGGDQAGARQALRRVVALQPGFPGAQSLLESLAPAGAPAPALN